MEGTGEEATASLIALLWANSMILIEVSLLKLLAPSTPSSILMAELAEELSLLVLDENITALDV